MIFSLINALKSGFYPCDPGEARTLDPLIKSQLLYQLSYGVKIFGKNTTFVILCKKNTRKTLFIMFFFFEAKKKSRLSL